MSELLASFRLAVARLDEALLAPNSDLHRDAAIQRFEFCFELGWKAMQKELLTRGIRRNSPRDCIQEAWAQGWIDDEAGWLVLMKDRNLTVHTYKEQHAREFFARLRGHYGAFVGLLASLEKSS